MEENIKLVKDFSHTPQIMRQGIRAYQKKFVYPKAIVKSVIFVLLSIATVFISGMLDEKIRLLGYLALVGFLALAYREIFNPLKQRDNIIMSMNGNGIIPLYRLTVKEKTVEISTVCEKYADDEKAEEIAEELDEEYSEEAVKPTIIPIDDGFSVIEAADCFVLVCSDYAYYIVPKADFSPEELEIIRSIAK
ncbi:MAG: YcxB family protein [Ruminococcus sp.]|nr:YcxB family protein [Ruminococcus sp.]